MSQDAIAAYRAKRRRMGDWMFARFLRNQGVSFENAYFIMFGRMPRPIPSTRSAA